MMKGLAFLFSLILAAASAAANPGSPSFDSGQIVTLSSLSGGLEIGRATTITLELQNSAATAPSEDLAASYLAAGEKALGIEARLQSKEEGVTVLSGPQHAGALGPGENRSVKFTVRAGDEAGLGIHPFELILSYSLLSGIEVAGEESLPDITFRYREISEVVPLQVEAGLGPRIELEEARGSLASNGESSLEIAFANRGDASAEELQAQIEPQGPFGCVSCTATINALAPGEKATAKFRINASNAPKGDYALPFLISYVHGGEERREETAAYVQVSDHAWMNAAAMPAALLISALLLLAFGIYFVKNGRRSRSRRSKGRL